MSLLSVPLNKIFPVPVARVFLRPDRVCLVVCRLFSTLAPSRDAILPPVLSDFLFRLPPVGLSRLSPRTTSSCLLRSAFPAESLSLSPSSSRSAPRVAAGFPRTPVLVGSPLHQAPRAQQPRLKETDRSPSCATPLLRGSREREREKRSERGGERDEGGESKTLKENGEKKGKRVRRG